MLLEMMMLDDGHLIGSTKCLYLPKAELKTKNSTKRRREFGFIFGAQLDSLRGNLVKSPRGVGFLFGLASKLHKNSK